MRVGLVLDDFDAARGGLARWLIGFARHLRDEGHEVHVVAFGGLAENDVALHLLPPLGNLLARARAVEVCLAGLGLDAVLDTGTGWSGDVFLPCTGSRRWSQARLVATEGKLRRLRSALSPRSRLLAWEMARLEREQVRRARSIVAVSSLVRALLERQHRIAQGRMSVVVNGVDTAQFAPECIAGLRAKARRDLELGSATVFLGSAHNMPLKGMDLALRALAVLRREGRDVRLLLAGAQPDRIWLERAAPVRDRVRFLGLVEDMAPLFAAADVLVHPTRWDACSLSTIEAGAAGLPVITTVHNGAAELIRDGVSGFVLPDPEDVPALANAMRRLLSPPLRARMGQAALAASASHDVQANFAAVAGILVANNRAGNAPAAGS